MAWKDEMERERGALSYIEMRAAFSANVILPSRDRKNAWKGYRLGTVEIGYCDDLVS